MFDGDGNLFDRMGDDDPGEPLRIDFLFREYLDHQRRMWPEHREKALRVAMQQAAHRVARMVDRGQRLPQTIEETVGRYRLFATVVVKGMTVELNVYSFNGTDRPWFAGLDPFAVMHDERVHRGRYVVVWHGDSYTIETRGSAAHRLPPGRDAWCLAFAITRWPAARVPDETAPALVKTAAVLLVARAIEELGNYGSRVLIHGLGDRGMIDVENEISMWNALSDEWELLRDLLTALRFDLEWPAVAVERAGEKNKLGIDLAPDIRGIRMGAKRSQWYFALSPIDRRALLSVASRIFLRAIAFERAPIVPGGSWSEPSGILAECHLLNPLADVMPRAPFGRKPDSLLREPPATTGAHSKRDRHRVFMEHREKELDLDQWRIAVLANDRAFVDADHRPDAITPRIGMDGEASIQVLAGIDTETLPGIWSYEKCNASAMQTSSLDDGARCSDVHDPGASVDFPAATQENAEILSDPLFSISNYHKLLESSEIGWLAHSLADRDAGLEGPGRKPTPASTADPEVADIAAVIPTGLVPSAADPDQRDAAVQPQCSEILLKSRAWPRDEDELRPNADWRDTQQLPAVQFATLRHLAISNARAAAFLAC